ncbi:GNAT family N-acetyltransferase [Heyndrickxia ginsengihumi]|uniref:GNAT family N-acetyltransferase n=1 Tax=Heyndrickxia ginsengihumi TaxID=363870 RepID=UPI003D1ADF89
MLRIRNVKKEDLSELIVVEQHCFSEEEAATEEAFKKRIELIPDSFFVAEKNGVIVGLVNCPVIKTDVITDDLFDEIEKNPEFGGHQSILGLAVDPNYQNQGIATTLLAHLEKEALKKKRTTITLTCKEYLIPFYEHHGFQHNGVSKSQHGGAVWYNMSKHLS